MLAQWHRGPERFGKVNSLDNFDLPPIAVESEHEHLVGGRVHDVHEFFVALGQLPTVAT